MLIQHARKKANWSSKRYETSKWKFGDAALVTEWNTVTMRSHTNTTMNCILSENFLTKKPIYNLTL